MRTAILKVLNVANRSLLKYGSGQRNSTRLTAFFSISIGVSLVMIVMGHDIPLTHLFEPGLILLASAPVLPALGNVAAWLTKRVRREPTRTLDSEHRIPADLYRMIRDLLKSRGITNVKKYITEHPEHAVALDELFDVLCSHQLQTRESWTTAVSLIFISDNDPFVTRDSILTLLNERGVETVGQLKSMLEISTTTATPLASGVL